MKKLTSIILVVVLLFSTTSIAFASEKLSEPTLLATYDTPEGKFYTFEKYYQLKNWAAIVYVPNNGGNVTFDARENEGESVYSSIIERSNIVASLHTPLEYAKECVEMGFETINHAQTMIVADYLVQSNDVLEMRDSSIADIEQQLKAWYGDERDEVIRTYYNHFANVSSIEIHENVAYRYSKDRTLIIPAQTTLSAAALMLGGVWALRLEALATILGVVGTVIEMQKTADIYSASAIWTRYGTVNGGSYAYCSAEKFTNYEGIDERYNSVRVYLNELDTYYVPSEAYYNSHISIANDTYDMYMG